MRLHVIEDSEFFPPILDDCDTGHLICLDTRLDYNFGVGDQIQSWEEGTLWVYIVTDIEQAIRVMPRDEVMDLVITEPPETIRLVKLDPVF